MLGIDLTTISRFENLNPKVVKRFLHHDELNLYYASSNKAAFLAAHWAIKEALYKADHNLKRFSKIKLEKKAGQYFFPGFNISTTNEGNLYLAIVSKEKL